MIGRTGVIDDALLTFSTRHNVRGDAARIFYVCDTYGIMLTTMQRQLFEAWSTADPPHAWERLRDKRISAAQGNHNGFVR